MTKYLVTVPIIGYGEYVVDIEDEGLSIENIKTLILDEELDLEPDGSDPIKEYTLVTELQHNQLPDYWPTNFEVSIY